MTTQITLRNVKGSPLTFTEFDNNFSNLQISADTALSAVTPVNVTISSLTANQVLDTTTTANKCTIKYVIQLTSSTDMQAEEILIMYDGTNTYITEYSMILTNSVLANFSVDYTSGAIRLLTTPIVQPLTYKFMKQSLI